MRMQGGAGLFVCGFTLHNIELCVWHQGLTTLFWVYMVLFLISL